MDKLKLDIGVKTYALDEKEKRVISFNPHDFNILSRAESAQNDMDNIFESYRSAQKDRLSKGIAECDSKMRDLINSIFDSDVCTAAFGNTHCCSVVNGVPIFQNYVVVLLNEVKKIYNAETKKIEKYTTQVKK